MRRCRGVRNWERLPEAQVTEGVSIDEYSTFRATRFSAKNGGA